MMNTMKFANMDEYLDKSSSEVIISKITRGKSFHPAHIDVLKKEIDGYLKLSEHFRDYMAFTSVYGEVLYYKRFKCRRCRWCWRVP